MISHMARILALLIVPLGFIISCDFDVPIKEMTQAKAAITKAQLVMAEKYDKEDLSKSEELLYKSHDFVLTEKAADAKKAAEESRDLAMKAINISLPRAAEDTLAEAKTTLDEADKLNAESFAQGPFGRAKDSIAAAERLKAENKLLDSFLKSKEGLSSAKEAKEMSLLKAPQLTEAIAKLKKEVDDLKGEKIGDSRKKDLTDISTKLDKAGLLVTQKEVKQAAILIGQADNALGKIKASVKKQSLKERIAKLRQDVELLKKERGAAVSAEDIAEVVGIINEADSLLEQDKIEEAFDKVLEGEKNLEMAKNKSLKAPAYAKWESVGKLIETAKKKDAENKHQEEITGASLLHSDSKELLDSEYYREGLEKLDEAVALLNSMGIVMEKDLVKKETAVKTFEGKRTYKVIYNKASRDCLWRIASKVYKQARLWPLIYTANKDQIKDPDLIFPGQVFVIPEVPSKSEIEIGEKKEAKDDTDKVKPEGEKKEGSETEVTPEKDN